MVLISSCKQAPKPEVDKAVQMAMWLDSVPELKTLNVSNAEVSELAKAHEAGLGDPSSVILIKLAREHRKPFVDGQSIADLLHSGSSEATVLELARMNELGVFAGEARAMRLAGLSDKILLAVALRRSQGRPVLSGGKLGGTEEYRRQRGGNSGNGPERVTRTPPLPNLSPSVSGPPAAIDSFTRRVRASNYFLSSSQISFCDGALRVYPR